MIITNIKIIYLYINKLRIEKILKIYIKIILFYLLL